MPPWFCWRIWRPYSWETFTIFWIFSWYFWDRAWWCLHESVFPIFARQCQKMVQTFAAGIHQYMGDVFSYIPRFLGWKEIIRLGALRALFYEETQSRSYVKFQQKVCEFILWHAQGNSTLRGCHETALCVCFSSWFVFIYIGRMNNVITDNV